jgi:nitronate monooxygenase
MTDKPFGVNLTILPAITPPPYAEYFECHHRERHQDRRDRRQQPQDFVARLKERGIKIVTSARRCACAVGRAPGVDASSASTVSNAPAILAKDDIPNLILIRRGAALKIPIVASGGIGDGAAWRRL